MPTSRRTRTLAFTTTQLDALKPSQTRQEFTDAKIQGLTLRIAAAPSSRKTWAYTYIDPHGRLRRLKLGLYDPPPQRRYPQETHLSLKDARERAGEEAAKRRRGDDPASMRQLTEHGIRFDDLAARYLQRLPDSRWSREKRQYLQTLSAGDPKRNLEPWQGIRVAKLKRQHIQAVLGLWLKAGKPVAANRLLATLRHFFNWAINETTELPEQFTNPALGIKPQTEHPKDRHLSAAEIRQVWTALERTQLSDTVQDALRLILLTGQRPGEVRQMHRDEVAGDWWVIPPEKMKRKLPHRVYLGPLAQQLLDRRPAHGFLFPKAEDPTTPMAEALLSRAVSRNQKHFDIPPFTPHDFRRTFKTHLIAADVPERVVNIIQNHQDRSVAHRVYNQYDYLQEREWAMRRWERILLDYLEGKTEAVLKRPDAKPTWA